MNIAGNKGGIAEATRRNPVILKDLVVEDKVKAFAGNLRPPDRLGVGIGQTEFDFVAFEIGILDQRTDHASHQAGGEDRRRPLQLVNFDPHTPPFSIAGRQLVTGIVGDLDLQLPVDKRHIQLGGALEHLQPQRFVRSGLGFVQTGVGRDTLPRFDNAILPASAAAGPLMLTNRPRRAAIGNRRTDDRHVTILTDRNGAIGCAGTLLDPRIVKTGDAAAAKGTQFPFAIGAFDGEKVVTGAGGTIECIEFEFIDCGVKGEQRVVNIVTGGAEFGGLHIAGLRHGMRRGGDGERAAAHIVAVNQIG